MKLTRRNAFKVAAIALAIPSMATVAMADGHAKKHTVQIKGFAFEPAEITVSAGDTIEFINADGAPHTATADNSSFDTGRLSKGEAGAVQFSEAGTFDYFCKFHPGMRAKVIVQ